MVTLRRFTIGFQTPATAPAQLHVYPGAPTVAQAASGAVALATGVHVGGGVYEFDGVRLDFNAKFFAVLPFSQVIFDEPNVYAGGAYLFPMAGVVDEGGFDIGFRAVFVLVPMDLASLATSPNQRR